MATMTLIGRNGATVELDPDKFGRDRLKYQMANGLLFESEQARRIALDLELDEDGAEVPAADAPSPAKSHQTKAQRRGRGRAKAAEEPAEEPAAED